MTQPNETYEKLVLEEDELITRIKICEGSQWSLLSYVSKYGEVGKTLGEEFLTGIHQVEQDLRTELFHLRLEKGFYAETLKARPNSIV